MALFRAFSDALQKRRSAFGLGVLHKRTRMFTPSDWLVVTVLGIIMGLSAATMLAGVSTALTTPVPARGGTYIEGIIGSPRFINPLLAISDTDRDLTTLVYSGLLKAGSSGALTSDIAESYTINEDGTVYTFVLRSDARFHDGTIVTAEDVAFTIHSAQNPDVKSPRRADWEGVDVTVIDPQTVTFTLPAPYAPFPENVTIGILPKHLWEEVSAEEFSFTTLNANPVGSGPYRIESIRQNNSGIPVEYRFKAFTDGVRIPYIERFIIKFYPNEKELQSALERNEVEAASAINPQAISGSKKTYEAVFSRIFGVFFNQTQNTLFTDLTVRKALDAALDKKAIIDTVLNGYGSVIDGPLPPSTIAAKGTETAATNERIESARAILIADGWEAGENGVLEQTVTERGKKTTVRLAFSLSTSNAPELKRAAELVAESWSALGAEVSLKFFEQNDLSIEVIRPRRYDALLFGEVVGREPDLFAFWHSSQRNDPGLNIALYANTSTDTNLEEARSETDSAIRREKLEAAAVEIQDEVAAIFLYAPHFVYLAPERVSGITFSTIAVPSDRYSAVDEWYLSTERIWPVFENSFGNTFKNLIHL